MVGYESIISGNAEATRLKNVTDSSLDFLQIDENLRRLSHDWIRQDPQTLEGENSCPLEC